jgi:hypothetical protein
MLGWRRTIPGKTADVTDNSGLSSRAAWRLLTRRRRWFILLTETALIVLVALIGHMTGREMGRRHLLQRDQTIQQLREERQEVSAELNRRADRILTLQNRLNHVQGVLDEIVPSENIYLIRPNQSLIVGGGRVIVGLIGSPTNEGVNVNVNGNHRLAAAGDVIMAPVDEATTCRVTIQSFDMFKALVHATCPTKAK